MSKAVDPRLLPALKRLEAGEFGLRQLKYLYAELVDANAVLDSGRHRRPHSIKGLQEAITRLTAKNQFAHADVLLEAVQALDQAKGGGGIARLHAAFRHYLTALAAAGNVLVIARPSSSEVSVVRRGKKSVTVKEFSSLLDFWRVKQVDEENLQIDIEWLCEVHVGHKSGETASIKTPCAGSDHAIQGTVRFHVSERGCIKQTDDTADNIDKNLYALCAVKGGNNVITTNWNDVRFSFQMATDLAMQLSAFVQQHIKQKYPSHPVHQMRWTHTSSWSNTFDVLTTLPDAYLMHLCASLVDHCGLNQDVGSVITSDYLASFTVGDLLCQLQQCHHELYRLSCCPVPSGNHGN